MLEEISRLPDVFRANAAKVRLLAGAEGPAVAWDEAARLTEEALSRVSLEPLSLELAAQESGYTRCHLRRMLREGTIPNAGTDSRPRILRHHLPRKPGFGVDRSVRQPASLKTQAARAVIEGEQ